jgi:hypothetical protein
MTGMADIKAEIVESMAMPLNQDAAPAPAPDQEIDEGQGKEITPQEVEGQQDQGDEQAGADENQAAGDSGDTEDKEIEYLTELTGYIDGASEDSLYGLKVKAGDGSAYTLGELKDIAQKKAEFEAERSAFATNKQEYEQQQVQQKAQAAQQAGQQPELPEQLQQLAAQVAALDLNFKQIDWKAEEEADPGEAALLRQKYSDARNHMMGQYHAGMQQHQQNINQAQQQYIAQEQAKTLESIPSWRDPAAYDADLVMMQSLAAEYGITPDAIKSISDHRSLRVWRDFAALKQKYATANANAKQVKQSGNPRLRASNFKAKRNATRTNDIVSRAKQPGATKAEKFAAQKALLQDSGVI